MSGIYHLLPQDPAAWTGVPSLPYHSIYVPPEQTFLSKKDNLSQTEPAGVCCWVQGLEIPWQGYMEERLAAAMTVKTFVFRLLRKKSKKSCSLAMS